MVKSREELLQKAAEWMNCAQNDLRNKANGFIKQFNTTPEEMAYSLGVNVGEIRNILNGTANPSLDTFVKLLIATDHAVMIQPLSSLPNHGGMKMPKTPKTPSGPARDASGRFVKKGNMPPMMGGYPSPSQMGHRMGGMQIPNGAVPQPMMGGHMTNGSELESMERPQLEAIINQNGWSHLINVRNACRGELIDFIKAQSEQPMPNIQPSGNVHLNRVNEEATAQNTNHTCDDSEELGMMFAEALRANPQLKNALGKLLGK